MQLQTNDNWRRKFSDSPLSEPLPRPTAFARFRWIDRHRSMVMLRMRCLGGNFGSYPTNKLLIELAPSK